MFYRYCTESFGSEKIIKNNPIVDKCYPKSEVSDINTDVVHNAVLMKMSINVALLNYIYFFLSAYIHDLNFM